MRRRGHGTSRLRTRRSAAAEAERGRRVILIDTVPADHRATDILARTRWRAHVLHNHGPAIGWLLRVVPPLQHGQVHLAVVG